MKVNAALIQMKCGENKEEIMERTCRYISDAAKQGANIVCLQELFNSIYFCQYKDSKYYSWAESIPGPTTTRMMKVARENKVVLVVPIYELAMPGVYYNTAVVISEKGEIIGTYRKNHIPDLPYFNEKFYFKPGNFGYPVFPTTYGNIAVYICYDRHFPEGPRIFSLQGADIMFVPTATMGKYRYLWELENKGHAVANGIFVAGVNRVGQEDQMDFYGSSFFIDPRGDIMVQAGDQNDEIVFAEVDYSMNREIRNGWQFLRDRRPETYTDLVKLLP
jgi:beta-ureidopropionase